MTEHSPEDDGRHHIAPELLGGLERMPDLDLNDEFIAAIRQMPPDAALQMAPPLSPELEAINCEERHIPGTDGAPDIRVLIYTPPTAAKEPRPALLHLHGGGFVLGTPEINDASNRGHCLDHGCVVVSVDYRLAPETPFPGALEDCYAALQWLETAADEMMIDRTRIAVAGESAGGCHALALALLARDKGDSPVSFLFVDAPAIDDRTGSEDEPHPVCGKVVWTPEKNRYGWTALLGGKPGGPHTPPYAAPARHADVSGLPPTFLTVGAIDLFAEETIEFARRLINAGVPTELHVIPGAYHGFAVSGPEAPQVQELNRYRQKALARAFAKT